jgi:hypothetical protein
MSEGVSLLLNDAGGLDNTEYELEALRRKAAVAWFKVLSKHLFEVTVKSHEETQTG